MEAIKMYGSEESEYKKSYERTVPKVIREALRLRENQQIPEWEELTTQQKRQFESIFY